MRWRRRASRTVVEAASSTQQSRASRAAPAIRNASRASATRAAAVDPSAASRRAWAAPSSTPPTTPHRARTATSPASAPTAASPQLSPSACQSRIAAAGDRYGQRADASAAAAGTVPTATAARSRTG
jgi:hypothetical protein